MISSAALRLLRLHLVTKSEDHAGMQCSKDSTGDRSRWFMHAFALLYSDPFLTPALFRAFRRLTDTLSLIE
jgi:hypothetical protein